MLGGKDTSNLQLSNTLAVLQCWAEQRPACAKVLSKELLNRAESRYAGGEKEQAAARKVTAMSTIARIRICCLLIVCASSLTL